MAAWARRMHRSAANMRSVVTSCGHSNVPYPRRLEKVKFGVPLDQVCKIDIPAPLLVLILKINKEGPYRKDVFRAPGHQGNMKKLIHFLQNGRLVNIDHYSVYTIASVIKKFLRKLPGGIFGPAREEKLFDIMEIDDVEEQREEIHSLIATMPLFAQRLLVLLFGTFRLIAANAEYGHTGMSSEALGVSVAPSFFISCVSDGKQAKMEDIIRFKTASKIMSFMIDNFGVTNLFGRENYEFYARITGRILKIEEEWIFAFRYPPEDLVSRQQAMAAQRSWLQCEAERWGINFNLEDSDLAIYIPATCNQGESQSTPTLVHVHDREDSGSDLGVVPENSMQSGNARLSVSLEEAGLFKPRIKQMQTGQNVNMSLDELKAVNKYAESTRSLSFLPQVHERQTARMRTRSEWFLAPIHARPICVSIDIDEFSKSGILEEQRDSYFESQLSPSQEDDDQTKENIDVVMQEDIAVRPSATSTPLPSGMRQSVLDKDCTELNVQKFHVTLTYKPRL